MAKYLTKISKFGGQYRLTIPRSLIDEYRWHDVEYVILEPVMDKAIRMRRFIDGESLKTEVTRNKAGSD